MLTKVTAFALLILTLVGNCLPVNAQPLRDPTRPGVGAVVEKSPQQQQKLKLNSVLLSGSSATAVFNNQLFTVGDKVQGVKIVRINNNGVWLADGRQFTLYQAVTETKGQ
nr:MSHA biogenesis protein MshK [Shewanella sp. Isolate11]